MLRKPKGFSFTRNSNPPLVLFIFGRKRVLPVNITSMNITETEFSTDLNPLRATVAVNLTVIEGKSVPYRVLKGHGRGDVRGQPGEHHRCRQRRGAGVVGMFSNSSRYRNVPDVAVPDARGRIVLSKDIRPLPEVTGTFRHTVNASDRLDQLAFTVLPPAPAVLAHLRCQPGASCRRLPCSINETGGYNAVSSAVDGRTALGGPVPGAGWRGRRRGRGGGRGRGVAASAAGSRRAADPAGRGAP